TSTRRLPWRPLQQSAPNTPGTVHSPSGTRIGPEHPRDGLQTVPYTNRTRTSTGRFTDRPVHESDPNIHGTVYRPSGTRIGPEHPRDGLQTVRYTNRTPLTRIGCRARPSGRAAVSRRHLCQCEQPERPDRAKVSM